MIAGSVLCCIISMVLSGRLTVPVPTAIAGDHANAAIASSSPVAPPVLGDAVPIVVPGDGSEIKTSPRDVSSRIVTEQIRQNLSGIDGTASASIFSVAPIETQSWQTHSSQTHSSVSNGLSFFAPEQPKSKTNLRVGPEQRRFFRGQGIRTPFPGGSGTRGGSMADPPVGATPPSFSGNRNRQWAPERNESVSGSFGTFDRSGTSPRNSGRPDTQSRDGSAPPDRRQDYYPEGARGDVFLPPASSRSASELDGQSRPDDSPVTPPVSAYDTPALNLDGSVNGSDLLTTETRPLPITNGTLPARSDQSLDAILPAPAITRSRNPLGLFSTQRDLFHAAPLISGAVNNLHPGNCDCGHCRHTTTCITTCQPLCLTKTILVPEWYTVYSTVNETHYRPRIKEQPYFIEHEITHQVPVIETFPVIVKEPRVRNFKTYRKEEYQVPREVKYTVMVPKPKTRQVTSERKESYEVPEEEQYTVMVPKEKSIRKTRYKTVKEKEPIHKEYVVMVPQTRTRVKIDYETRKRTFVRKIPFTKMVERTLTRQVVKYRSEVKQVRVNEEYYEYVREKRSRNVTKLEVLQGTSPGKEDFLDYIDSPGVVKETIDVQQRQKKTIPQTYTVTVPYKEEIEEVFYENEAYEETADRAYQVKTIIGRDVTRPYVVKLPYVEHMPQVYTVKIPFETKETRYREVPRQMPVTKFQMVKRDMGRWVTDTISVETFEEGQDMCGCPTCCPKGRTVRKTRWVPNVVSRKIPFTTFKTVKQKVPYQVPVTKHRTEQRQRMIPVTKYRTEVRQAVDKVYSYETETKQRSYPVTKFRLVRKTRAKTVTNYREETRTRNVSVNEYFNVPEERTTKYTVREVVPRSRNIKLPATQVSPVEEAEEFTVVLPVQKSRQVVKNVTVRVPVMVDETYVVKVPEIDYREVNETEEYEVEVPREVKYTVNVPEIRTKTDYVVVERKVPYIETTKVTEMVPEIKTRRVFKTRSRTVSDVRTETYMTSEPEVLTKTVYDTLYRDVPVFKSELYWENVPKVLKKTVFKPVTRTIKRPAMRRYKVLEPYHVKVKVPQRAVRMVPRKITIPVEECCQECCTEFSDLTDACGAYIGYGLHHVRRWINGL